MDQLQCYIDFVFNNTEKLIAITAFILAVAGLIRAQLKLWAANAAGAEVTSAVTRSGSAPAVRAIMDAAPDSIKATVRKWIR